MKQQETISLSNEDGFLVCNFFMEIFKRLNSLIKDNDPKSIIQGMYREVRHTEEVERIINEIKRS